MHWCFECYGLNSEPHGPCVHCGCEIEGPAGRTYDDQLVWTLGHPDGDRAVLAAATLGARDVRAAVPVLHKVVNEGRDPYLAAAALNSVIKIAGVVELRDWLEDLLTHESFMVSSIARQALSRQGPAGRS